MSDLPTLPGVTPIGSGKVRELYAVGDDQLLLVATDRISAFDVVLPTPIPDKGKVLTGLTDHWLDLLAVPNHRIATALAEFPEPLQEHADALEGRAMLCRRAEVVLIECVARGYLAGSGWAEYRRAGTVCGLPLPDGLQESSQLPEPIFTPSTKAPIGEHDENISFEETVARVGADLAGRLRELTLDLYTRAAGHALERGIILADTKFEFGTLPDGELILIDEVLTPDSSRFWPSDEYEPGRGQASFDKQYVRDWLSDSGWDKQPPGPELPAEVVARTRDRYVEAYERLAGRPFKDWAG